jgi:GT2 family glycosyltransferase
MISICIPTYNYDINPLIDELSKQLSSLSVLSEIIVIDDNSNPEFQALNRKIADRVRYIQLKNNIGRASIRNMFLEFAQYDYLLFLDNDVLPLKSDFIACYINYINKNGEAEVVCGGVTLPAKPKDKSKKLRWVYGVSRESISAVDRQANPYQSFMSGNFLIKKSTFEKIRFDERLSKYGHEDTLFGFRLMENNIIIRHIENPIIHLQIESTKVFIQKTESAIRNIQYITREIIADNEEFINQNKLLRTVYHLQKIHLTGIVNLIFQITKYPIKLILLSNIVYLPLFDFYKLGYYCSILKGNG